MVSTGIALLLCEGILRWLGDYRLDRLELEYTARHTARGVAWYEVGRYDLGDFADGWAFSDSVDPAWLFEDLPPPPPRHHRVDFVEREARYGYGVNLVYERRVLATSRFQQDVEDRYPFLRAADEIFVHEGIEGDGSKIPYRLPAHATLPPRFTTNGFGWRGPDVSVDKPPDTVRIACLGASTTLNRAATFSYPELLQHWLNRWSETAGAGVRFEVLNAGRDGIGADAIAAIARGEVAPLEPDYLVYYEGANDLRPCSRVTFGADVDAMMPPDLTDDPEQHAVTRLARGHSATAERLLSLFDRARGLPEPAKPTQSFEAEGGDWAVGCGPADDWPVAGEVPRHLDEIAATADEVGARTVVLSFAWLVHEGLRLDATHDRHVYAHLNQRCWPCSYAHVRRSVDLLNRGLSCWASERGLGFIDVAAAMPAHPDLFIDAVHNTDDGVRVRAWIVFEGLLPMVHKDLADGRVPRADAWPLDVHPHLGSDLVWRKTPGELDLAQLSGDFVGEPL